MDSAWSNRGAQPTLFHSFCVEDRIRADHPLRDIKRRTDRIMAPLSKKFSQFGTDLLFC